MSTSNAHISLPAIGAGETVQLPGGLRYGKGIDADFFEGARQALIAAGVASADWFPAAPVLDSRGRVRRTFRLVNAEGKTVTLHERGRDRWALHVQTSEEEEARRGEEMRTAREAEERRKAEAKDAERRARLQAIVQTLPPFVPGSMSEGERYYMRLVRALDDVGCATLLSMVESLLVMRARTVEPPPPRRGLQLVVDNAQRPGDPG